jgi:hypothetical protein
MYAPGAARIIQWALLLKYNVCLVDHRIKRIRRCKQNFSPVACVFTGPSRNAIRYKLHILKVRSVKKHYAQREIQDKLENQSNASLTQAGYQNDILICEMTK